MYTLLFVFILSSKHRTEELDEEGLAYMGILHCHWRVENDNMSEKIICMRNKETGRAADRTFSPALSVNVRLDGEFGNKEDRGYSFWNEKYSF